ncbi:hypothetical protein JCM8547_003164 [Rhodosporidiobolus lusitaniae]
MEILTHLLGLVRHDTLTSLDVFLTDHDPRIFEDLRNFPHLSSLTFTVQRELGNVAPLVRHLFSYLEHRDAPISVTVEQTPYQAELSDSYPVNLTPDNDLSSLLSLIPPCIETLVFGAYHPEISELPPSAKDSRLLPPPTLRARRTK